jgi:hypothetical protein
VVSSIRAVAPSLALVVWFACAALAGCSSKSGDPCKGGLFVEGSCVAKCTPDKCLAGNTCVANACALTCASHLDCLPDGSQSCLPATEDDTGRAIFTCQPTGKPAGIGAKCPRGDECTTGLVCIGRGPGDADAYCTNADCHDDGDCVAGYGCAITRDPHAICGAMPPKGNDAFCGTTTEACIDPSHFADGGRTYFEGSECLLRRACTKRAPCSPCTSDLDCSRLDGQRCVAIGADRRCAPTCSSDVDCAPDAKCTAGACVPRYGACVGKGAFCDPCVDDEDCGSKGTQKVCASLSRGMRACVDASYSTTCTTDADCPVAPSGIHGTCIDERVGVGASDPNYHRCSVPTDPTTFERSCW